MNLQNILKKSNYWYKNAFETEHHRKPVFLEILNTFNNQPISILEIGTTGGDITDPNGIHGSGHSSFYFAEYIRQNGGSLTIVDIDPLVIQNAKEMLLDFIQININIQFICDEGLNYILNKNTDLIYLDGPDVETFTFEAFRLINRCKSKVLIDDANGYEQGRGKCVRTRKYYTDYQLYKCGVSHEMIFYDIIKGNNPTFTLGNIELPYYRENKGNREFLNERSVEIPLGHWFLDKFNDDIVELGAVLPYYMNRPPTHKIVDPYDHCDLCLRIDGEEYDYNGQNVLSLSTLEHLGHDGAYDKNQDSQKAIRTLEKIINTAQNYLLVWGVGQHPQLDEYIQKSTLPIKIMVRNNFRSSTNNWHEDNDRNNLHLPYGAWEMELDYYGNSLCEVVVSNLL